MSQISDMEIPDNESLEIVSNYLKHISTDNDIEKIENNIKLYIRDDNIVDENNVFENLQKSQQDNTTNNNSCELEIDNLKEKIELQKTLEDKLNAAIQKEKELLKITQEKLVCEVKLLETIKQRLYEEDKLNKNIKETTINNENNLIDMTQAEKTCENNNTYQTKVSKLNSSLLRIYKR